MNSPFRQSEVFNLGICGARTGDIIRRELPEALSLGGEPESVKEMNKKGA